MAMIPLVSAEEFAVETCSTSILSIVNAATVDDATIKGILVNSSGKRDLKSVIETVPPVAATTENDMDSTSVWSITVQPTRESDTPVLKKSDVADAASGNEAGRESVMDSIVNGMDVTMKPSCVFLVPSVTLTSLVADVPLIMRLVTPAVNASFSVE